MASRKRRIDRDGAGVINRPMDVSTHAAGCIMRSPQDLMKSSLGDVQRLTVATAAARKCRVSPFAPALTSRWAQTGPNEHAPRIVEADPSERSLLYARALALTVLGVLKHVPEFHAAPHDLL